MNAYEIQKNSSIAAGDTLRSKGKDKGQRLTFLLCVGASKANGEYIWKRKWRK